MTTSASRWQFAARISAAIGLLAMLSLSQGGINWWISTIAEQRVERGRIAADLHSGFIALANTKQQLKAWALQVLLGTVPLQAEGDRLARELITRVDEMIRLGAKAEAFDVASPQAVVEHQSRLETLRVLRVAMLKLQGEVHRLDAASPVMEPHLAWRSLERLFDGEGDIHLAELMATALERETLSLSLKRDAADRSLSRLKTLSALATALIAFVAMLLAIMLARDLRRPLADMMAGARALGRGELDHRIPVRASNEFGQLAASVNAMAGELSDRRRQEASTRAQLEERVREQTRELNGALEALQLSERRRRRLIAEISHELRTPTAAIRGEAEIALRGGPKSMDDYSAALTRIADAASQLGGVIDDLLTIAHSDADTLTLSIERTDLAAIVVAACAQARSEAASLGIAIVERRPEGAVIVEGDPRRLRQIAGLLLDNAVRYSHSGQTVTVALETAANGQTATMSVTDEGIGIPPTDLELIFERQHRAPNARLHRPDGAGLGLAIARDLADRHGGRISVTPLAVGARFDLTLPMNRPQAVTAAA